MVFAAETSKSLDQLDIPLAGSISGVVTLSGLSNHAGIDIYIPGTSYSAKTDKDGKFTMSLVPVGTHEIYMESDSFQRAEVTDIDVITSVNTEIDAVALVPSSGPVGVISLNNGAEVATESPINVSIQATQDTLFMRYGEDEKDLPATYVVFSEQFTYEFSETSGDVTLYVQLKDKDGLESEILKATITLNLGAGSPKDDLTASTLTLTAASATEINVSWTAVDGATGYVVISSETTINDTPTDGVTLTVGDSVGGAKAAYVGTATSFSDTGLAGGTDYFYKVFAYVSTFQFGPGSTVATEATQSGPIYFYATNAKSDCAAGGRSGLDALCTTDKPNSLSCSGTKAFVSTSDTPLTGLGGLHSFDTSREVWGATNNQKIFNAFSDIGTSDPLASMAVATGIDDKWYSGSKTDGSHDFSADNWAGTTFATYGTHLTTDGWINDGQTAAACNNDAVVLYYLCLCL